MCRLLLAALVLLGLPNVANAAFDIFQTYLPAPNTRVQKNLVTDYGATCDAQWASRVVTITNSGSGLRDVAVTVNTFSSGDVGKKIAIPGAAAGNNVYAGTIAAFVDAQHITLGSNAGVALSSSTQTISWGTDTSAQVATFTAAFQGSTPVQLNLPGNCGYAAIGGDVSQFPWKGIGNLIVAGNGTGTSAFVSLGSGNPLFGGSGQYQDNSHSLRTDDANAGDSCLTVKTQPSVTVSAIDNSLTNPAIFTASSSGTTMTVTAVASGTIATGAYLANQDSSFGGNFSAVSSQLTGTGGAPCPDATCNGTTGTYALTVSTTWSSQQVRTVPASFTASVSTAGVMTVSAVQNGTLAVGMWIYPQGGGVSGKTTITSQLTGTGGAPCPDATCDGTTGTYQLDDPPLSSVSSRQFQGNGQPRVTLNSTAGLTTGDTLYLTGITGRGALPQRVNGLRWIKVVNGTQIDIFQSDYDGSYSSGGTGGGDRTSLTPAGSNVMMSGVALQAYWASPYGFPSNQHFFEYMTVQSTNSGTHQVCFTTPLVNSYKASWPQMSTGNLFEIDPGGPATMYALDSSWELTHVYKDFTLVVPAGQTTANGRNITWENIIMTGVNCAIPTQNETHTWTNVDASTCSIETDKLVGTWAITGSTVKKVHVQSSSMNDIIVSNTTIDQSWAGSPKRLILDTVTINGTGLLSNDPALKIGNDTYGASDETVLTNVTISNGVVQRASASTQGMSTSPWTMASGVITIPNAISDGIAREYQMRWMVPSHYNFWFGAGNGSTVNAQVGRSLKIVSMTQDTVNTYVTTSEAGGFPTGTGWTTNGLSLIEHPAPMLTVTNGVGPDSLIVFNGCPAQAPMQSCGNFIYNGSATSGSAIQFAPTMWGELDTFTFTNNVPYTGGGALGFTMSQFANWQVLKTDLTTTTFGVSPSSGGQINVKLPSSAGGGTRTLTPSGATGTEALDSLTAPPAGALFGSGGSPIFSADTPSDSPQVTVTLRTNQNLPP